MQKLVTSFQIERAKISKKANQRLVIIPKSKHVFLKNIEDKQYLINLTIQSILDKKNLYHTMIIANISKMGDQRQIYIPLELHKEIKNLKDQYCILIEIQERS